MRKQWRYVLFEIPIDIITTKQRTTNLHYSDVIMSAIASQINSLTFVYSTVYSGADQRKHQSSESLAFVRGIHLWSLNSPHKWPVTRQMFTFDDIIMLCKFNGVRCSYVDVSVSVWARLSISEKRKSSWCQLSCHWWCQRLSLWQATCLQ